MASSTIPSIDFCKANMKPGSAEWESTRKQVFQALEEYGCFEVIYDKVPKGIEEDLFGTLKEIFPLEAKVKEYLDKPLQDYKHQLPNPPYNAFRRTTDLLLPQHIEPFVNTFYPDGNPHFCDVIKSYANSLKELDEMMNRMILESLGLSHYIDELMDQQNYSLRFVNYKKEIPKGEDANNPRLTSHADTGFLTIVKQDHPGIQVLTKNGEWIQPNVSPNSFIVIVADAFMAWTNYRLKSTYHKVHVVGDFDRLSIMLFTLPKTNYIIEARKELVDEEHPIHFKPYTIHGFHQHVMSVGGYGPQSSLKAYCGV
ncbi:hypothetical protein HAX54_012124 [Datura stramonium]|uniref:Fe2OG dioxygenase domain-containing protein n=1 Tax=Datura stramonium TaxID=4076 RepID=A0ABS8RJ41_DATST|nr:hypothetical protein [Datura stramonium]